MNRLSVPCGSVGRADLLRALAIAPCERLMLDVDGDAWFGYIRRAEPMPQPLGIPMAPSGEAAPVSSDSDARLPLQMPFVHAIVERRSRAPADSDRSRPFVAIADEPIREEDAKPLSPNFQVSHRTLLPEARLVPALRRLLGATCGSVLDMKRLVRHLAAAELPRHLPRRHTPRWDPDLVVVLDYRPDMWPYRPDMRRLAERLLRHCGSSAVSVRIFEGSPSGMWKDWRIERKRCSDARPWLMPPVDASVLIVSDLGLLHGADSDICRQWIRFVESLKRVHARPLALAPLGAAQMDAAMTRLLPILRWSPDAPMRIARKHGAGQPHPEGLDELLAMVAATRRIERPLLRELRYANPLAPLNAGLEGAFWRHRDVVTGHSAWIRDEARAAHLACFEKLPPSLQALVGRLSGLHHSHMPAALNHEETQLRAAHVNAEVCEMAASEIEQAGKFFGKLWATLRQPGSEIEFPQWWQFAHDFVARADPAMAREAGIMNKLAAQLLRVRRLPEQALKWIDMAELKDQINDDSKLSARLARDAASGWLLLQARPLDRRQSALGEPLAIGAVGVRVVMGENDARWFHCGDLPLRLMRLDDAATVVRIETGDETLTVAPLRRPRGAAGWSCIPSGIEILSPPLCGKSVSWLSWALRPVVTGRNSWALDADAIGKQGPDGALTFGIDAYGVWAEFAISTKHGRATQRLRWIEPGSFWMGSPQDEPERLEDEGPRHRVSLTQGFWLADSVCTQALWQAVMGNNPSYFKGEAQRPVEQVNWNEVQDFLRRIEVLLLGCRAGLPSEAEWEYACRAGSDTPFSFGAHISPEQVNYNGNIPYAGGEKGLHRGQTIAVKSLPPNAWGLYEMHGNVWEWCADGPWLYSGEAQQDPLGPVLDDERALCAVRGGSFGGGARRVRSACRDVFRPGEAIHDLGFRLTLRYIESGSVRPGGREVFSLHLDDVNSGRVAPSAKE